jgi:hypothetical protein
MHDGSESRVACQCLSIIVSLVDCISNLPLIACCLCEVDVSLVSDALGPPGEYANLACHPEKKKSDLKESESGGPPTRSPPIINSRDGREAAIAIE